MHRISCTRVDFTTAVATYIIQQVVEVSGNAELLTNVLFGTLCPWWILMLFGMYVVIKSFLQRWLQVLHKGYEYTHVNNRLWRKTRSRNRSFCRGVDPNRHFAFKVFSQNIYFLSLNFLKHVFLFCIYMPTCSSVGKIGSQPRHLLRDFSRIYRLFPAENCCRFKIYPGEIDSNYSTTILSSALVKVWKLS